MDDVPYSLKSEIEKTERVKLLQEPHIAPLTRYVDELRIRKGLTDGIPYFDPLDGGVEAECLFVLESPGRRGTQEKAKGSGFISRNNPDPTAKNFFNFNEQVGIPRELTVSWNIVPWYVGQKNKLGDVLPSDVYDGLPYLGELIDILPKLKVIVLMGGSARKNKVIKYLNKNYRTITLIESLHPGAQCVNRDKRNRVQIIEALIKVRSILQVEPDDSTVFPIDNQKTLAEYPA